MQFVVHSRKMNIDAYLEKLAQRQEQESEGLLKSQIAEYIEFVRSFVKMNAVMEKTFFVVIPFDPIIVPGTGKKFPSFFKFGKQSENVTPDKNIEQKLSELNRRTESVISGLTQIGLRAVALNDKELLELFYNLYNPSTVEKKDIKIER